MNELDVLREFRADGLGLSSSVRAAARARMFVGAAPSRRARSRRWHLVAAGGAVAAAVVFAVAVPVISFGQHSRPSSRASAATVLRAAAVAAAAQPFASGRYWYDGIEAAPNDSIKTWTAPDGQISVAVDGSPPSVDQTLAAFLNPVGTGPLSRGGLARLPTDPRKLRNLLASHIAPQTGSSLIPRAEWVTLGVLDGASDLLERTPAPPQLRAALFNVIAGVPGIVNDGPAVDGAGRHGTNLTWINPYPRPARDAGNPIDISYLIDQDTGAILQRTARTIRSTVTSVFITGYVNAIGTVPASP